MGCPLESTTAPAPLRVRPIRPSAETAGQRRHTATVAAAQDAGPAAASRRELLQRNQRWLEAYVRCRHAPEAISLRNRLVEHNLPLVLRLAGSMRHHSGLPFEDMVQVGSLGLIRAIEAWDGRRGVRLSSFAVPYIRGAIQREMRDRLSLLRIPRPLWELRQRAHALQERQRRQNRPELGLDQLCQALGCDPQQLLESLQVGPRSTPCSLDAPRGSDDSGAMACLLDTLAAPCRDGDTEESPPNAAPSEELLWMRRQLLRLDPISRRLVEGRVMEGLRWSELGPLVGLSPAAARRRGETALARLRQAAAEAFGGVGPDQVERRLA